MKNNINEETEFTPIHDLPPTEKVRRKFQGFNLLLEGSTFSHIERS